MAGKSHPRPQIGTRYRVTDGRHRIFEGLVRSVNEDLIEIEVTAGKAHFGAYFLKSVDTTVGGSITVRASRCSFERL